MRRAFYDEELDYGLNFADLNEFDQMHVMNVLNGFEEPLDESDNKEYKRIRMDCPDCTNGFITCPNCIGTGAGYICWKCGGDRRVSCGRCFGVGSIVISLEDTDEYI